MPSPTRGHGATLETDESLPEVVRETFLSPGDQYQISYEDGWLYGELPDLQHEHYGDPRELGYFRFAFNDKLFISGRRHPLQSVDDVRQAIRAGQGQTSSSPIALFNAIFRRFLDLLKAEIAKLSETLNSIEDHIVGENWQGERERLVPVRRQIVVFHRYLTAATSLFRHIDHADRRALPEDLDDLIEALSRRAETLHAEGDQLQQRATAAAGRAFGEIHRPVEPIPLCPVGDDCRALAEHRDQRPFRNEYRRPAACRQRAHGFWIVALVALAISALVYLLVAERSADPGTKAAVALVLRASCSIDQV